MSFKQKNKIDAKTVVSTFFKVYDAFFKLNENGEMNIKNLKELENWYNNNYLLWSLLTGINLTDVHFENQEESDQRLVLHIYSVCHLVYLKFKTLP